MLTLYSDPEKRKRRRSTTPTRARFSTCCKRRFAPRVALLHDYPLYEFTVLVRKEAA